MTTAHDKQTERIMQVTQRLAVMKARQLLREMRRKNRDRRTAHRVEQRRRLELGQAVLLAQCGNFQPEEVVGLLLEAKDRVGNSPTQRLAVRKRGQEWLSQFSASHPDSPAAL